MLYHNEPSFIVAFRSLKLIQVVIYININNKALVSVVVVFIKILAKTFS